MKVEIVKRGSVTVKYSMEYCCAQMAGAIEQEHLRAPMASAKEPSVLLGGRVVSFCPFCGEKVEIIISSV